MYVVIIGSSISEEKKKMKKLVVRDCRNKNLWRGSSSLYFSLLLLFDLPKVFFRNAEMRCMRKNAWFAFVT